MICHINLAKGFRGGERQTYLLVKALTSKIKQTIIVRKNSKLAHKIKSLDQVKVIEISKPFFLNLPKFKHGDLIHAHEAKAAHLAFFSNLIYKTPYVITRRVMKNPKVSFFFKQVHTRAQTVVAISSQVGKKLKTIHPCINTQIIPSSFSRLIVNGDEVVRLKAQYSQKFIVGHVGALVNKDKGQIHIIRAAQKISQKHPDIHFLFLGEGKDRDWFVQEAQDIKNLEFLGFKENIGDYYALFDLFLFPSLDEGLGSSILDAFYSGLPVIATRVGGIPDIIDSGENGLLIEKNNEDTMVQTIETLYTDPNLCKKLKKNGEQTLSRFDISQTSTQYLNLYREILACREKQI